MLTPKLWPQAQGGGDDFVYPIVRVTVQQIEVLQSRDHPQPCRHIGVKTIGEVEVSHTCSAWFKIKFETQENVRKW